MLFKKLNFSKQKNKYVCIVDDFSSQKVAEKIFFFQLFLFMLDF